MIVLAKTSAGGGIPRRTRNGLTHDASMANRKPIGSPSKITILLLGCLFSFWRLLRWLLFEKRICLLFVIQFLLFRHWWLMDWFKEWKNFHQQNIILEKREIWEISVKRDVGVSKINYYYLLFYFYFYFERVNMSKQPHSSTFLLKISLLIFRNKVVLVKLTNFVFHPYKNKSTVFVSIFSLLFSSLPLSQLTVDWWNAT